MTRSTKFAIVSISSCLLLFLLLGTVLGQGKAAEDAYKHFAVYTEVLSRIKSEYVEEPDMKGVTQGALIGLLESIDPYASYLSADQFKQYLKSRDTRQAGVGLVLSRRVNYIGIESAIPGSPAETLGLTTGDVIEAINDVATRDMPLAYAEMILQGEPGTSVELSVIRVRQGAETQKVAMVRQYIDMPQVTERMMANNIGYLRAPSLENGKTDSVRQAIQRLERQGATKMALDLRYCAAGTPEEGFKLADLFLNSGSIGYWQGQKVARENVAVDASKTVWDKPLVAITSRGTGSGCEIVASALLSSHRAEIVGERTYGDASRRRPLTLNDGGAVILSVAKFYPPEGAALQDTGVTPTLPVPEAATAEEATGQIPPPARDLQLRKAVEVLTDGIDAARASGVPELNGDLNPLPNLGPLNLPQDDQK